MLHEQIKIIIRDGIVESVLSDCVQIPAEVEVVDVNRDYADFEQLRADLLKSQNQNQSGRNQNGSNNNQNRGGNQ